MKELDELFRAMVEIQSSGIGATMERQNRAEWLKKKERDQDKKNQPNEK